MVPGKTPVLTYGERLPAAAADHPGKLLRGFDENLTRDHCHRILGRCGGNAGQRGPDTLSDFESVG